MTASTPQRPTPQTAPEKWPGSAYPLGSTYDGAGTNFALFSAAADKVELCLIDREGNETRVALEERDNYVWHGV